MKEIEVKDYFYKKCAPVVLKKLFKDLKEGKITTHMRALELMKPVISQIKQTEKLKAKNASDVLSMLKAGTISIADAKDLMSMLKDKAEIDELPVLLRKLEELEKKT